MTMHYKENSRLLNKNNIFSKSTNITRRRVRTIAILLVIISILMTFTACGGGSSVKHAAKQLVKATYTADKSGIKELLSDESEEFLAEMLGCSATQASNELMQKIDTSLENINQRFGDKWTYKYKIESVNDVPQKRFVELSEIYEQLGGRQIKEAKVVNVSVDIKYTDGSYKETESWTFVKIGNKWYWDVINTSMNFFAS